VKALVFQARSSLIASKQARETSCETIREQLVELKGGSLRRNTLRRHLKECTGCTEFRAALQHQRGLLALALPVVPSVALKQAVLGGTVGTSTAAAGAGAAGGGVAGVAGGSVMGGGASLTAKVLVVAAVAGGGATAAGVKSVVADPPVRQAPATAPATGGAAGVPDPTRSGPQAAEAGPAAADPASGRRIAVSGAGAAGQAPEAPATSARPDAAPGKVKEEGASAKPDDPPGQVKDAPARPETAPPDQAKADEKPAKAEKEEQPVTEEKPEKVKPESPEDAGYTPTTGKPAPGTGKGNKPERPPGQAEAGKPAQPPAKSRRPASSGGGSLDEPLAAPAPSSPSGQGKSAVSDAAEMTTAGKAGLNGNAGGNGKGRAVGLNLE
jgi:hypothetical protein